MSHFTWYLRRVELDIAIVFTCTVAIRALPERRPIWCTVTDF